MKIGFDNNKYLQLQSEHIRERINQFGDKLYLEFGGKLFDDYHASRVLPGFAPDSKLSMLMQLADQAEIIIAINAADIAGVACCGHGKGLYLWGKDGKPARPGIISTDNRAWEYPLRWEKDGTAEKVFAKSCQHIMACQPVSLLQVLVSGNSAKAVAAFSCLGISHRQLQLPPCLVIVCLSLF